VNEFGDGGDLFPVFSVKPILIEFEELELLDGGKICTAEGPLRFGVDGDAVNIIEGATSPFEVPLVFVGVPIDCA
jgi:hypothetical protein